MCSVLLPACVCATSYDCCVVCAVLCVQSAADYAAAEQQPQMQEQYYGYEPSAASYDPSPYGIVAT